MRREAGPRASAKPVLELLGRDMGVAAVWMIRGGNRLLRSSGCSPRDTTAGRDRETLSLLKAGPRPRAAPPPRIETHRQSASSCPCRHPSWVRRNQALTPTWWHLPRVGEQRAISDLTGQGSVGRLEVSLSSHAHTTCRPREPATTARDMHRSKPDHPGLGPRAPQGPQHLCLPPAAPQRSHC